MWTVNELTKELNNIFESQGCEFKYPVKINGRLTRTLGRCILVGDSDLSIEFSKQLLETATDESIIGVIKHEAAHALTWVKTGTMHGHDEVFRDMCKKIGCDNDRAKTKVERLVSLDEVNKYTIKCKCCGKSVAFRRSKCKLVKNPELYSSRCCRSALEVVQNW